MITHYHMTDDDAYWLISAGLFVERPADADGTSVTDLPDRATLEKNLRYYGFPLGVFAGPGPDYEKRGEDWHKIRYTKKDFLLLCGFEKVAALNAVIRAGNDTAKTVHDFLFASDFIDVTDPAAVQMVNVLATEAAGNILTAEDVVRVLAGELYEAPHEG